MLEGAPPGSSTASAPRGPPASIRHPVAHRRPVSARARARSRPGAIHPGGDGARPWAWRAGLHAARLDRPGGSGTADWPRADATMPAMSRVVTRSVLAIVWLLIVAVVSVGAAGIVSAMANQPGTAARAELTADGDAAAAIPLEKAQTQLADLTTQVERLGELGRGALTALVASDFTTLDSAVADGQTLAHQ